MKHDHEKQIRSLRYMSDAVLRKSGNSAAAQCAALREAADGYQTLLDEMNRLTDEIRLTEIKRRALFNECVRLYCGQEMRLGEAQIRADMIMDRAVAAVSDSHDPFDDLVESGGLPEAQALAAAADRHTIACPQCGVEVAHNCEYDTDATSPRCNCETGYDTLGMEHDKHCATVTTEQESK